MADCCIVSLEVAGGLEAMNKTPSIKRRVSYVSVQSSLAVIKPEQNSPERKTAYTVSDHAVMSSLVEHRRYQAGMSTGHFTTQRAPSMLVLMIRETTTLCIPAFHVVQHLDIA